MFITAVVPATGGHSGLSSSRYLNTLATQNLRLPEVYIDLSTLATLQFFFKTQLTLWTPGGGHQNTKVSTGTREPDSKN